MKENEKELELYVKMTSTEYEKYKNFLNSKNNKDTPSLNEAINTLFDVIEKNGGKNKFDYMYDTANISHQIFNESTIENFKVNNDTFIEKLVLTCVGTKRYI